MHAAGPCDNRGYKTHWRGTLPSGSRSASRSMCWCIPTRESASASTCATTWRGVTNPTHPQLIPARQPYLHVNDITCGGIVLRGGLQAVTSCLYHGLQLHLDSRDRVHRRGGRRRRLGSLRSHRDRPAPLRTRGATLRRTEQSTPPLLCVPSTAGCGTACAGIRGWRRDIETSQIVGFARHQHAAPRQASCTDVHCAVSRIVAAASVASSVAARLKVT